MTRVPTSCILWLLARASNFELDEQLAPSQSDSDNPIERQSTDCVRDYVRIENTLWHCRRNSLTTRRFARKLTTPFYHARLATCPVRHYKRRAGHSSIPRG